MNPSIVSWNGHALNTGAYKARFPNNTAFYAQQGVGIRESKRTDRPPALTGIDIVSRKLTFIVNVAGGYVWRDQVEELHKWFDPKDKNLYTFVIADADDSNRQWYVNAKVEDELKAEPGGEGVQILLRMQDDIWRTVTENSDAWAITASGQTNDVATIGNRAARLRIQLTPTNPKTNTGKYKAYRAWRNVTAYGQSRRMQDITNDAWNTATIIKDTSKSNQINFGAGYSSSALSFAIDTAVGGGLDAAGGMCYVTRTGEQIRYTSISGSTMTVQAGGRGWGGTTAAALVDNDVLNNSKMVADGRDLRAYVNGISVPLWIQGINTTTTQVFVNLDWAEGMSFLLRTTMDNSTTPESIKLEVFPLNLATLKAGMQRLAQMTNKEVIIGTECISFTDVLENEFKISGLKRGINGTAKAAHSLGDSVYYQNHNIYLSYGSPDATAPVQDEKVKPLQDLTQSTNTSWKWLVFFDKAGLRAGGWMPRVTKGVATNAYLGTETADADPATDMGMSANVYSSGGTVKSDSYEVEWSIFDMAGFNGTPSWDGERYRFNTDWATTAETQKSNDGVNWIQIAAIVSPSTAGSWANTWSQATALAGTFKFLRILFKGSIKALVGNAHHLQVGTVTLPLDSSKVPSLVISGAEELAGYQLDAKITNNDTGEYITLQGLIDEDQILEVNCDAKTITYLADNSNRFNMIDYPVRGEWLTVDPSVVSDNINTYTYEETGVTGMTVNFYWYDRIA